MSVWDNNRVGRTSERGATAVELLAATASGLLLAALCSHTFLVSHATYRSAAARMDRDQRAQFALALISAEVGALLDASASTGCPDRGIRIATGRMEFSANLYDRDTALAAPASVGSREVMVDAGSVVEVGDMVQITDPGDLADPSDDAAECAVIEDTAGDRLTLTSALARSFPAWSPAVLLNRVTYRLDGQGRLMRTQDRGTQRIADQVAGFDAAQDGRLLTLRLTMQDGPTLIRRLLVENP
ncbi:MAG: PilW family protein [Nitrospirota bacterium]